MSAFPLLLAQAAPVVLNQDVAFSWPVVLVVLGLAGALGESRWRITRLERDVETAAAQNAERDRRLQANEQQVAVVIATLGRIEKGQEHLERLVREALNRPAA